MFTVGMRIMLWETWIVYSSRNKKPKLTESYRYIAVNPKSKDQIWHKEMAEIMWNFSQQPKLLYHQIQQEAFQYLHQNQNSSRGCSDHYLHLSNAHFPKQKMPWNQLNPTSKRKCSQSFLDSISPKSHSISPNSQPLCFSMFAKPKPFSRWKYFRDGSTLQIIL